jgi:hypothetical protein
MPSYARIDGTTNLPSDTKDLQVFGASMVLENAVANDGKSAVLLLDWAQKSGRCVRLEAGDLVQVVDIGGKSYGVAAFNANDLVAAGYQEVPA